MLIPVLIVDDDPDFLDLLSALLEGRGYAVTRAQSGEEALERAAVDRPAIVVLDWQLDGHTGLDVLGPLQTQLPRTPIILTTAYSSTEVAVLAMRQGAFDFLPKPVEEARLITTLAKAAAQHELLERVHGLEATRSGDRFEGLLGGSPPMRALYEAIENVASADVSVLITGESGTGKELVARAIHARSARRKRPFVALNMAAIPKELVESTLFGHERGAFSGADRRRVGACEEAHGGTLFLDEIGEMPLELQAKLLRFLQEQSFRRVGGSSDLRVDVRIVSATNRPALEAVRAGVLRADLYYRLSVVPVSLPPLRERRGDVSLIAQNRLVEVAQRYGKGFRRFSAEALGALEAYPWPGNVRELLHLIERVVISNHGEVVQASMLPEHLRGLVTAPEPARPRELPAPVARSNEAQEVRAAVGHAPAVFAAEVIPMETLERMAIEHALRVHRGSREDAARALGISHATIYRKLKAYGLTGRRAGAMR